MMPIIDCVMSILFLSTDHIMMMMIQKGRVKICKAML